MACSRWRAQIHKILRRTPSELLQSLQGVHRLNVRKFHKFYEGSRQEYFLPSAHRQSHFDHLLQAFLLADVCDGIQPAFCRIRMSVARNESGRIQRFYFRICRELAAKRSRRIDSFRRFNSVPRAANHPRFEGTSFFFLNFSTINPSITWRSTIHTDR